MNENIESGRIIAGIVGVLTVGIAGYLVFQGFMMPPQSVTQKPPLTVPTPTSAPVVQNTPSAPTDSVCDLVMPKGPGWDVEYSKGGGIDIVLGTKHVLIACAPEIPGIPLPPEKISDIMVDGVAGKLYHDASAADGTPEDDVRVRVPMDDMDVSVRGTPGFVSEVVGVLKWAK